MFNFKMNNRNWQIEETSQEEIKTMQNKRRANEDENVKSTDTRYYGITYADTQKIYLDKDLTEDRKRATLIHELTHCYIIEHITHCDKTYDEEMIADIVSNCFDIIKEIVNDYFGENKVIMSNEIILDRKSVMKEIIGKCEQENVNG